MTQSRSMLVPYLFTYVSTYTKEFYLNSCTLNLSCSIYIDSGQAKRTHQPPRNTGQRNHGISFFHCLTTKATIYPKLHQLSHGHIRWGIAYSKNYTSTYHSPSLGSGRPSIHGGRRARHPSNPSASKSTLLTLHLYQQGMGRRFSRWVTIVLLKKVPLIDFIIARTIIGLTSFFLPSQLKYRSRLTQQIALQTHAYYQ